MRFLLTGGAGFIRSHLADELLAREHWVQVLDDLLTGSIEDIRHLRPDPRFGYTIDSCRDLRVVTELVDQADYVHQVSAAVGVQLIVDGPVRTIEANVHCTEIVLAQASNIAVCEVGLRVDPSPPIRSLKQSRTAAAHPGAGTANPPEAPQPGHWSSRFCSVLPNSSSRWALRPPKHEVTGVMSELPAYSVLLRVM